MKVWVPNMLVKLLFTLMIVLAVALIFRTKRSKSKTGTEETESGNTQNISSQTILYTLLGLIISVSILIFFMVWSNQHQIINIQVTDGQGQITTYQAYSKTIKGRKFVTLDGVDVVLGENDRVEMIQKK